MATTQLQALAGLGRDAEALALGEQFLARALETEQGIQSEHLRMVMALMHAKQGHAAVAIATADDVIARFTAAGISGLNLGLAYETRARIALSMRDLESFGRYAALCRPIYYGRKNQALTAKYEKLMRDARRYSDAAPHNAAPSMPNSTSLQGAKLVSILEACITAQSRADVALSLLLEHSRSGSGYLFALGQSGPNCVARANAAEPSAAFVAGIRAYVAEALGEETVETVDDKDERGAQTLAKTLRDADGPDYRPLLLSHYTGGKLVVSGVAALQVTDQFVHPGQVATEMSAIGIGLDST
jgi:hypothetical protein